MGRALGYGTRHLAKTFTAVAEAATAPGNAATAVPTPEPNNIISNNVVVSVESPRRRAAFPRTNVRPRNQQAIAGAKHLKRSFFRPLAVYSGALWLRVTGTFFALLAFTMATGVWRSWPGLRVHRSFRTDPHFWVFLVLAGLFGYFAVTSFLEAGRLEQKAAGQS